MKAKGKEGSLGGCCCCCGIDNRCKSTADHLVPPRTLDVLQMHIIGISWKNTLKDT